MFMFFSRAVILSVAKPYSTYRRVLLSLPCCLMAPNVLHEAQAYRPYGLYRVFTFITSHQQHQISFSKEPLVSWQQEALWRQAVKKKQRRKVLQFCFAVEGYCKIENRQPTTALNTNHSVAPWSGRGREREKQVYRLIISCFTHLLHFAVEDRQPVGCVFGDAWRVSFLAAANSDIGSHRSSCLSDPDPWPREMERRTQGHILSSHKNKPMNWYIELK